MHAANTRLGSEVHALIDAPDDRRAFRSVKSMRAFLVLLLAISRSRAADSARRLGEPSPRPKSAHTTAACAVFIATIGHRCVASAACFAQ